jgi:hypothetical protein
MSDILGPLPTNSSDIGLYEAKDKNNWDRSIIILAYFYCLFQINKIINSNGQGEKYVL